MYVAQRLPPGADHVPPAHARLFRPRAAGAADADGDVLPHGFRPGRGFSPRGAGGAEGGTATLPPRSGRCAATAAASIPSSPPFDPRNIEGRELEDYQLLVVVDAGDPLPPGTLRQCLRLGADGLGARARRGLCALCDGRERPGGRGRSRPPTRMPARVGRIRLPWNRKEPARMKRTRPPRGRGGSRSRIGRTHPPWNRKEPAPTKRTRPPRGRWRQTARRKPPPGTRPLPTSPPWRANSMSKAPGRSPMSLCAPSLPAARPWTNRRWRATHSCARRCPTPPAPDFVAVGVRAENGVPARLAYAFPGEYAPTPPAGLEDCRWFGGPRGWWVRFVPA